MRIDVRGAGKRFGAVEALRGVDLVVPPGSRVALVGPNGSGKSTLIRALLGLIDCDGEVLLDGRSPFENRVEVARRLAYVPQVAPALGATVKEVMDMVTLTRGMQASSVVDVAARLALDVPAVKDRPFRYLSGGMKQKFLLSLAFAARPSLLVMDEPTASLDARARDRVFELCSELPPETTVLLCSHRLEELRQLARHVVAMEEGRVVFDGPASTWPGAGGPGAPLHDVRSTSAATVGTDVPVWVQAAALGGSDA